MKIADIVHFVEEDGETHSPAIITAFDTNGAAFLTVFGKNGVTIGVEANESEVSKTHGTYHIPE